MGPQQSIFYCILDEFSEICWLCCFMSTNFSRKKLAENSIRFRKFFKKSMCYTSKWSQMERFWEILMKSPRKLHTSVFRKFRKFLKICPPPKFTFYCMFKKEILAKCVVRKQISAKLVKSLRMMLSAPLYGASPGRILQSPPRPKLCKWPPEIISESEKGTKSCTRIPGRKQGCG